MSKLRPITKFMFLAIALLIFSAIFVWEKSGDNKSNSEYFAIITTKKPDSPAIFTAIQKSPYKNVCESAVDAAKVSLENNCPQCTIEAMCADKISVDFRNSFDNKPLSLAYFSGDSSTRIFIENVSIQESNEWCNSILEDMSKDFLAAKCIKPL